MDVQEGLVNIDSRGMAGFQSTFVFRHKTSDMYLLANQFY